jgi:hypothetical protein
VRPLTGPTSGATPSQPFTEAWWGRIDRAVSHVTERSPEHLPSIRTWLEELETAFEDDDDRACWQLARAMPAVLARQEGLS